MAINASLSRETRVPESICVYTPDDGQQLHSQAKKLEMFFTEEVTVKNELLGKDQSA